MKRLRGYRVGRKVKRVFRWLTRPRRNPTRLTLPARLNPVSRLTNFLRRGARSLRFGNSGPKYIQLGQTKPGGVDVEVPKGHLAVYVAESGGDTRRVVVPVIYFNHPLFGELLREAERVYGYDHPGGITIPCGHSEFEKVKTRIAKWDGSKRRRGVAGLS